MRPDDSARDADIYVQIPAYRDRELAPTLRALYGKAARPGRLRVRVLWQYGEGEDLPGDVRELPGLELVEVPAPESRGCNWARRLLQRAWRGERYTLLLDSHHRFAQHWDDLALSMLEGLRSRGIVKPMLTGYLPAYRPAEEGWRGATPQHIYPYQRERGILTRLRSLPVQDPSTLTSPVPADFASLHFILADGRFNAEVPFEPEVYFFGDEVLVTVRSFSAGFRLFHPHRVIGWHAYDRGARITHWHDHDGYDDRHKHSLDLLRREFRGEGTLGTADIAAFEAHAHLSLVLA